ncbi:MAG: pentapeptide MXKDX repeat protein [Gammaproteobacteria bacterium]
MKAITALVLALGLACGGAGAFADEMGKGDGMAKDEMSKSEMGKDEMGKGDAMAKDEMAKPDAMAKDEMKK